MTSFISKLCNQWSFPYIADLNDKSGIQHRGLWLPKSTLDGINIDNFVDGLKREYVAAILDGTLPAQNRSYRRRILSDPNLFKQLVMSNPSILKGNTETEQMSNVRSSLLATDIIRKYVLGQISRSEANTILAQDIIHPENVYKYYFKQDGNENPANALNKRVYAQMLSDIDKFLQYKDRMRNTNLQLLTSENAIKRLIIDSKYSPTTAVDIISSSKKRRRDIKILLDQKITLDRIRIFSNIDAATIESNFASIATAVYDAVACNKIKKEPSLAGDMIHAAYLPVCNLWRGDRAMSRILIDAKVPNFEKIVPELKDLPNRIESAYEHS
jgi:hypothetical protein